MKKLLSTAIFSIAIAMATQATNMHIEYKIIPGADSCFIYIFRGGSFSGALTNFAIYVDNQKLCKLSNNRYFKIGVKPGKHTVSAHRGGIGIGKKETEVEVDCESGKSNFISCSMKSSITRVRLEMEEVVAKTGMKDIADMKLDKCQATVDEKD
jgi:hypothetical protein